MTLDYSFARSRSATRTNSLVQVGTSIDAAIRQKQRTQEIRGLAATLECMLGAVGGYSYAALLGLRPGMSNTEALRHFIEQQMGEGDDLPDLLIVSAQVRRALDRAVQARDEF